MQHGFGRRATAAIAVLLVAACSATTPGTTPASGAPGSSSATPVPASSSAGAATLVPADDPDVRIQLTKRGPTALRIAGDRAWVAAFDDGQLTLVDLVAGNEIESIPVGPAINMAMGADGTLFLALFDPASHFVIVDSVTHATLTVPTGDLESLAVGPAGKVWAIEKTGRLLLIDPAAAKVVDDVTLHIQQNLHQEVVWDGASAWVASDATPVEKIDGSGLTIEATVEVGGGIPFTFVDGLVWGARADELWAIDPVANQVVRRVPLAGLSEILSLEIVGSDAWIAARKPGRIGVVVRLDVSTGHVLEEHAVSLPSALRIAGDRVWVLNYDTNELLGFDRG